jgi:site-specific recombinase XerD
VGRRKNYAGSIEKRGDSYRIRLCIGGKRHYYTVRTTDRRAAERLAREKYHELERRQDRRAAGLPGAIRVSALLEQFENEVLPTLAPGTQRSYRDTLKPVRVYFITKSGDPRVDNIHAAHIAGYLTWRRTHGPQGENLKRPISTRTLQKDRAVLHRIFGIADRLEYRDGNPVSRIDPPKPDGRDPVILSDAQYECLLAACKGRPMLRLYVLTLGETGARCESEALHLRWEDVKLDEGFIWVDSGREGHRTKSGKGRWVPMTPSLLKAMRQHFARYRFARYKGETSPWVFHHAGSRRRAAAGERIKSLRESFRSACERAKLPAGFVQHDLRHRRVTTWLAQGKNPVHVKEAVGHASLATTMAYTHLAREHLRSLVDESKSKVSGRRGG